MNRPTLALIIGASAIAVLVLGLVVGISTQQSPTVTESQLNEPDQAASAVVEPDLSQSDVPQQENGDTHAETSEARDDRPGEMLEKEAEVRALVRDNATAEVERNYALLFENLGLTPSDKEALLAFFIEDKIANTKTRYSDGIGMPEEERSATIAEIIGDTKLQEFLALERNILEYRELRYLQAELQENGVPLSRTQQDQLLKILVDARDQVDGTPPEHIERGSIEELEFSLRILDERERLVLELAPSALSTNQVEYMFERNQEYSYERAATLELHKQRRAENPDDDMLLWYPSKRD